MTTPATVYKCETFPRGHAWRSRCGKPATIAEVRRSSDGPVYSPICNLHAAAIRRREARWSTRLQTEFVPIEAGVAAQVDDRIVEAQIEKAAAAERKHAEYLVRKAAADEARNAQHLIAVAFVRDDKDGDIDWDATQAARAAGNPNPMTLGPKVPHWTAGNPGSYGENTVEVDTAPGVAPRIAVRTSSDLTVNAAKALAAMLLEAVAVAEVETITPDTCNHERVVQIGDGPYTCQVCASEVRTPNPGEGRPFKTAGGYIAAAMWVVVDDEGGAE